MPHKRRAYDVLSASQTAQKQAELAFGLDRQITIWHNTSERLRYDNTEGHVFSLYLKGGERTAHHSKHGHRFGWPGAVSVLPEGHCSEWSVHGPFCFLQFYVPDNVLRGAFAETHDCDARRLRLAEQVFDGEHALHAALSDMSKAVWVGDTMAGEAAFADLTAALSPQKLCLNGGLTARALRRIDDYIEAHLEGPIQLADLASLTGLSAYHFHRMFLTSRGLTPQAWVMNARLRRAKSMLSKSTIAAVATACGFSSQSHFTRAFKANTGLTPGRYQSHINGRAG